MAKTTYNYVVTCDNGEVLQVSGWYYKDFPAVGEQKINDISDCFVEMP